MIATNEEQLARARVVHRHAQLMRTYILQGDAPAKIWDGMEKQPTIHQMRAMLALHVLGPMRLKSLAERLGVSQPAASELVERLVEMRALEREQDPNDRRQVVISLHPDMAVRVGQYEEHMLEKMMRLMSNVSPETADNWVQVAAETCEVLEAMINSEAHKNGE